MLAAIEGSVVPPLARPTIIGVALVYFVGVMAIGAWATRRTRTVRDFYVAGEGIGIWALGISAMAASLSGFVFVGGPGLVYSMGFGAVLLVLPAAVTSSMVAWVLAKRLRLLAEVRGVLTIPDAIGARYQSRLAQGLSGLAILCAITGYMATNFLALGLVIDAIFGTGITAGIWLGVLVTVAYTASGGILAGIYTDLLQGGLMALVSAAVFMLVLQAGGGMGGLSERILASDPGFLGPWGRLTPLAAISFYFVFSLGALGQPHVIHKFYMLRDPARLKWYPVITTGAMTITLLLYLGVGLAVRAEVARGALAPLTSPDTATTVFLLGYTPLLLAALAFSGIAAAVMSTVNSFMNVGAAVITHDLPVALGRRGGDRLWQGRFATVALSMAAAALAMQPGAVVALLGVFGWGLFASTLVPALGLGLNWQGATRAGALASITTGLVVTLVLELLSAFKLYTLPTGLSVAPLSLVLSLLAFLLGSWLTRHQAADQLDPDIRALMET